MTKPNIDTKGMFGDNKRREGRIWGLSPKPSPMDKFVVKDLQVHGASEEAIYTNDRRTQRGKGWVGEVDGRTHPEGRGKEQEEEKSMLESKERTREDKLLLISYQVALPSTLLVIDILCYPLHLQLPYLNLLLFIPLSQPSAPRRH